MNRRYFADRSSKIIALVDTFIFVVSLAVSILIRAQFSEYRVKADDIAVLGPTTIFLRLFITIFFEHYSFSTRTYLSRDYMPLFFHNLIPTGILLLFRFLSPLKILRLPISVIFVEYVFTSFGMILVRYIFASVFFKKRRSSIKYRPRVLLYCNVDVLKSKKLLNLIKENDNFIIKGLLITNPMYWDTQHYGLRVLGDESIVPRILFSDDSISAICLIEPNDETRKKLESISEIAKKHNMEVRNYEKSFNNIKIT